MRKVLTVSDLIKFADDFENGTKNLRLRVEKVKDGIVSYRAERSEVECIWKDKPVSFYKLAR